MKVIENPILKGFNPDPSIVRVGDDYYIATSTFEWFPGVTIYHSKDLVDWQLITSVLDNETYLNLVGIDSSCGIWAPNLTYSNGVYYLLYTVVYTNRARYKDTHNFLVTAEHIDGPWSKPVFLNCSGFDPSLFHDDDGTKWLVNMTIDHRVSKERFSGVEIQQLDTASQKLTGPIYKIFKGTSVGKTEGPNIIKHNGFYYLICAEGGTEFGHCVTVARAREITGIYEVDPCNPILTSKANTDYPIQRAGHGQLFNTLKGNWYMVHLCSRPVQGCSILGRETALQNIEWTEDGWFKISGIDNTLPRKTFLVEEPLNEQKGLEIFKEDFDQESFSPHFMSLREAPIRNGITTRERGGYLRIYGGNSLSSKYKQGLLARRQQSICYDCTVSMEFNPHSHRHMAGLTCYYNYDNYHYLKISFDEALGVCINVTTCSNKEIIETDVIAVPKQTTPYYLKAEVKKEHLCFFYSLNNKDFISVGKALDMKILSDEQVQGNGFTGAMVGICCQDLQGDGTFADFDWFEYKEV